MQSLSMQSLTVWVVLILAVAVFLTTPLGKSLTARLGLRFSRNHLFGKGRAPREDHDYLLRVCNDDPDELRARLEAAREHNPEMTEAESYRRAIRAHLRPKA
jgi:hypothetical protein